MNNIDIRYWDIYYIIDLGTSRVLERVDIEHNETESAEYKEMLETVKEYEKKTNVELVRAVDST